MNHLIIFYETINGPYRIIPEWSLPNIFKKKQRKNKIAFVKKILRILEMTMWFKLHFTCFIWIYLKVCQNRRYKWKLKNQWTIWVKPYCPWLNFFSSFARYFGKCIAVWIRCVFDKIARIFVKRITMS